MSVRSVGFVLSVLLIEALSAHEPARAEPDLMAAVGIIHIDGQLRPTVRDMLARSPTFRRQWNAVIEARRVHVSVFLTNAPLGWTCRARTTIRKYSSGLLLAVVQIPPQGDYAELVAHEFEHVIEQIEGIDLAALSRSGATTVKQRPDGAFEAVRAQHAGEVVAAEVRVALLARGAEHRPASDRAQPAR